MLLQKLTINLYLLIFKSGLTNWEKIFPARELTTFFVIECSMTIQKFHSQWQWQCAKKGCFAKKVSSKYHDYGIESLWQDVKYLLWKKFLGSQQNILQRENAARHFFIKKYIVSSAHLCTHKKFLQKHCWSTLKNLFNFQNVVPSLLVICQENLVFGMKKKENLIFFRS